MAVKGAKTIAEFDAAEAAEVEALKVEEIDRQVRLGNFWPLLISDGRVVGCEQEVR